MPGRRKIIMDYKPNQKLVKGGVETTTITKSSLAHSVSIRNRVRPNLLKKKKHNQQLAVNSSEKRSHDNLIFGRKRKPNLFYQNGDMKKVLRNILNVEKFKRS
ncbi:hypothetical protein RclHR1_05940006 [Rhizophagus clarus]|nr:hypothetical protein RclHR1_05940006 [Rhizophagus clarus]